MPGVSFTGVGVWVGGGLFGCCSGDDARDIPFALAYVLSTCAPVLAFCSPPPPLFTGGPGRCYAFWDQFSECLKTADTPMSCKLAREVYDPLAASASIAATAVKHSRVHQLPPLRTHTHAKECAISPSITAWQGQSRRACWQRGWWCTSGCGAAAGPNARSSSNICLLEPAAAARHVAARQPRTGASR